MTGPRVLLVGAGPGDPELLTLRAEAVLAAAAVVVSDAAVLDLAQAFAPRAEVVVVADGRPAVAPLLSAAERGGAIVRLYVGDPWLSSAHGEELSALNRAGIATEAVPGVAVEVAGPALAGIAVHVRHLAIAFTLGPIEAMPTSIDPARTLVVRSDDGAAAAGSLAANGGDQAPAALLPLGGGSAEVRGPLRAVAQDTVAVGPSLLVVGAVAAPMPGTPDAPGETASRAPGHASGLALRGRPR